MAIIPGKGRGLFRFARGKMLYEMPGRASSPRAIQYDPETIIWRDRVLREEGGFLTNSISIADGLIRTLKRSTFDSKLVYLNGCVGLGINAFRVPLLDRLNVGPATNNNFVDADCSQPTGLQGDGSTKFLNTNIFPSQLGPDNCGGFFWWENNANLSGNSEVMGCYGSHPSAPDRFVIDLRSGFRFFSWGQPGNAALDSHAATNGFYYGQRSDIAQRDLYLAESRIATNTASDAAVLSASQSILLCGAYGYTFAGGYVPAPWPGRMAVAGLTNGKFTAEEVGQLQQILRAYLLNPVGRPG